MYKKIKKVKDPSKIREALTFDDVLLLPAESQVQPNEVDTATYITQDIRLNIPVLSAAMDTVTEAEMAIAMAQNGGIGVMHRNMDIEEQAMMVRKVKRFESGIVLDPITIGVNARMGDAWELMSKYNISGFPVTEENGRLVGILTNRDMRFADDEAQPIKDLMTTENLVTATPSITKRQAKELLHQHRIEKLLLVDDKQRCIGLMTVKDIEKSKLFPMATKDAKDRLRAAAAVGTGDFNGVEAY